MSPSIRRLGRLAASRPSAAIADQIAFSLANFLILFSALHWLGAAPLGAFTLTMTLTILLQTAARSLVLEPLSIRFSTVSTDARRRGGADAAGASLLIGTVVVGLSAAYDLLSSGSLGMTSAAGATLVALLVQDAWRFTFFAGRQPWRTALNDTVCLLATAGLLWFAAATGRTDGTFLIAAWGLATAVGAVLGCAQLRTLPSVRGGLRWLRDQRDVGLPLMGSTLAQQAAGRLSLVLVATLAGHAALGLVSASRTLLTPMTAAIAATFSIAVPDAVRRLRRSPEALRRYTSLVSGVLLAATAALSAAIYVLPTSAGRLIAGQNWENAHSLLVPTALWVAGMALSQGPRVGMRALGQATAVFRVSCVLGVILLACTTVGVVTGGATGAAWGFGLASVGGQVLWQAAYRRALRLHGA